MTAEDVFKFYRAYKFYYDGSFDFKKYHGHPPPCPPLIKQFDRSYYYRLSQKLNDATIHALFTVGFFFNPRAHVSNLASPEAQKAALLFASRAENGVELLKADLYELAKRLRESNIDTWLYGELDPDGSRDAMPDCIQQAISGHLPLDVACLVLLIPQTHLHYNWPAYWAAQPELGLGPGPWIDRLKKLDQLLNMQRTAWRMTTHKLAKEFWSGLGVTNLAPQSTSTHDEASLF